MSQFIKGQRWLSETEPELGLAIVVQAEATRVQVVFPASAETRIYAVDNAPLKRVRFRVGDTIKSQDGKELTIREVVEPFSTAVPVRVPPTGSFGATAFARSICNGRNVR